jgi:hypothetical protein
LERYGVVSEKSALIAPVVSALVLFSVLFECKNGGVFGLVRVH